MKNKAFTLIELLTVIVIIAILTMATIPIITNSIKSSKDKLYDSLITKIINSAMDWSSENTDMLPKKGESISITLGILQSGGYISTDLKDPKTDSLFPSDMIINITYVTSKSKLTYGKYDGNYAFVVDVNSGTKIKSIKGDYIIVELNSQEEDINNILYKDDNDEEISLKEYSIQIVKDGLNVEKIDSSKEGIYYTYYSKIDGNKKFTKTFKVADTKVPDIIFEGEDTISKDIESFDLYSNVRCEDNSNSCKINIVEGEEEFYDALSNKQIGNYVVKYEAKDQTGNSATKKRVIEIE